MADAAPDALRSAVEEAQRGPRIAPTAGERDPRGGLYRLDQGTLRVAEKGPRGWEIHGWIQQGHQSLLRPGPERALRRRRPQVLRQGSRPSKSSATSGWSRRGGPLRCARGKGRDRDAGIRDIGARVGAREHGRHLGHGGFPARRSGAACTSPAVSAWAACSSRPAPRPVIVEDGAFIGSRCIVVEGVLVEEEAVLGAGVVLTASTPIYDVTSARSGCSRARSRRAAW